MILALYVLTYSKLSKASLVRNLRALCNKGHHQASVIILPKAMSNPSPNSCCPTRLVLLLMVSKISKKQCNNRWVIHTLYAHIVIKEERVQVDFSSLRILRNQFKPKYTTTYISEYTIFFFQPIMLLLQLLRVEWIFIKTFEWFCLIHGSTSVQSINFAALF